jgi:hypothetical protein
MIGHLLMREQTVKLHVGGNVILLHQACKPLNLYRIYHFNCCNSSTGYLSLSCFSFFCHHWVLGHWGMEVVHCWFESTCKPPRSLSFVHCGPKTEKLVPGTWLVNQHDWLVPCGEADLQLCGCAKCNTCHE